VLVSAALATLAPTAEAAPPGVEARDGNFTFSATADRDLVMADNHTVRVRVDIGSLHEATRTERVPTDIVVVLDHSGSMSGSKIRDAQRAVHELIGTLSPTDRFSLVPFSSGARTLVDLSAATPVAKRSWTSTVNRLGAGGGTNMTAGLAMGSSVHETSMGRAQRLVLISDGQPNTEAGLRDLAMQSARNGVPLTTVGIGDGYNDPLMRGLADAGTGGFYYAEDTDLAKVFRDELQTGAETVAKSVVLAPELARGVTIKDAAGLAIDGANIRIGSMYASQERSFWLTLDVTTDREDIDLGVLSLEVVDTKGVRRVLHADLPVVQVTQSEKAFVAGLDHDAWGQSVVQEEWNKVRQQVSAYVQAGDGDAAKAELATYRDRVGALNRYVGNTDVTDNLSDAEALEAEVEQTMQQAPAQQRSWSNTNSSSGWSARRSGSTR
jgi:Ca-activated chloride channel family protein